ncbi:hypothetical protein M422DRAFT_29552 [Sphaerobolus stellatus SS14]|uniref:N-acetyltransferase domain-containing protein n=1 Tax=Sphaerobolus stellatus (strain SS14) TaxID=990650 RepID=A0A0C9W2S2_SPHS4|nr:hypothetical protein M422DRAFT_29552 [Sphaerobolus stellatus SS14]
MATVLTKVSIKQIALQDTYPIRLAILYPNGPEAKIHIPNDTQGTHFGAFFSSQDSSSNISLKLAAVISVFEEPLPPNLSLSENTPPSTKALRFRKFACLKEYQGKGIGTSLFQSIIDSARRDHELSSIIWCDARWETREWYLKRGMKILGDTFMKGDIEYAVMAMEI